MQRLNVPSSNYGTIISYINSMEVAKNRMNKCVNDMDSCLNEFDSTLEDFKSYLKWTMEREEYVDIDQGKQPECLLEGEFERQFKGDEEQLISQEDYLAHLQKEVDELLDHVHKEDKLTKLRPYVNIELSKNPFNYNRK